MKSSIALASLVAAAIGLAAIVPALADNAGASATVTGPAAATSDTAPDARPMGRRMGIDGPMGQMRHMGGDGPMGEMRGGMGGRNMLALACSDRGSEALERMLDRAADRLELTDEQTRLFDTFRTNALTTQTSFADSCTAARGDVAGADASVLDRMKTGLAIETARVAALNQLLPDFEALFNSLTDAQKADLFPHFGMGRHQMGPGGPGDRDQDRGGMPRQDGRMQRPAAPGR